MRNVQLVEFMLVRRLLQRTQTTSIYEAEGGGMLAQKGDVDRVANLLHALRQELEALSPSTFPAEDKEQQRFLEVVRECENMLWGGTGGIAFRKDLPWGQAAREMQSEMQPLLREVCAMQCSSIWYLQKIHEIRALVDGICAWQAEAVAEQAGASTEGAWAKAYRAGEDARAAVMSRVVEAFTTVTVVAGAPKGGRETTTAPAVDVLTAERLESLRAVVKEMRENIFTLKEDVKGYNPDKLALIESVERYQESCCGENTWIWNAETWEAASGTLQTCLTDWKRLCGDKDTMSYGWSLRLECEACVHDMAQYKQICDNGTEKEPTSFLSRMFRLRASMDALKDLV